MSFVPSSRFAPVLEWSPSLVARWRQDYDARGEAAFAPPEPTPSQALEARVAGLERFCGQLAYEIKGG